MDLWKRSFVSGEGDAPGLLSLLSFSILIPTEDLEGMDWSKTTWRKFDSESFRVQREPTCVRLNSQDLLIFFSASASVLHHAGRQSFRLGLGK